MWAVSWWRYTITVQRSLRQWAVLHRFSRKRPFRNWKNIKLFQMLPDTPEDIQLSSVSEYVEAQRTDTLCARLAATVGKPVAQFVTDKNGVLVRRATIDGSLQKIVPTRLCRADPFSPHNPVSAGHLPSRWTYDTMRSAYRWPYIDGNVYRYVEACVGCRRNWQVYIHQRKLQPILASVPTENVAMDILGPLPTVLTKMQGVHKFLEWF